MLFVDLQVLICCMVYMNRCATNAAMMTAPPTTATQPITRARKQTTATKIIAKAASMIAEPEMTATTTKTARRAIVVLIEPVEAIPKARAAAKAMISSVVMVSFPLFVAVIELCTAFG